MANQNVTDPFRDIFLAGVGALAIGAEKSKEIVNQLVQKGQITVDQGKEILGNLKDTASEKGAQVRDDIIAAQMKSMTKEEREAFVAKIADIASRADEANDAAVAEAVKEAAEADAKDDSASVSVQLS